MAVVRGTGGDDNLTGTSGNDNFILWQGGNDTVHAGDGNDTMRMGNALTAADQLDGGDGRDAVILNGDYSAGLVLGATTITNVEVLGLVGGHSYNLTMNDGNVAAGQKLIVEANDLGAGDTLTFDGSAETDGRFYVVAGSGDDTITGGAQNDIFHLEQGGTDTVHGGGGNDAFYMGTSLGPDDRIDGGTGYDKVFASGFAGGNTITFTGTTMQGAEDFVLSGSNLDVTTNDATVAAGAAMIVDASAVNGFTFDGSAETDGRFYIIGGAGDDTLTGGAGHDVFDLSHGGNDTAHGGGGNDTFNMGAAFNSGDQIDGGAGNDTLQLNGNYSGGYTFSASQLTSIESIVVAAGHTYGLTMNDANVASGATMTIDASALGSSDQLFFDGTAETDGHFAIISGAGEDVLTGGKLSDTFDLSRSNGADASGFDGNDTFTITTAASLLSDLVDGGAGTDTLVLNGNFSTQTTITASNVENIEALTLLGGTNSYNLVLGGGGVEGTGTFTIDGSAAAAVTLDLTNADTRTYAITGSAGADTIKFGTSFLASDTIDGGAGNDTLALSGGDDIVFGTTTLTSIETLKLTGGSFDIATNDGNVGAGDTLTVDATALTTAQALTFNGSAETDGNFVFEFGGNFTASDTITGGAGDDTLSVSNGGGSLSLALSSTAVSSVETLQLFSHINTTVSVTGDIADGSTLNIDSTSARLNLDLSAATSSAYDLNITSSLVSNVTFGGNFTASDVVHGDNTTLILDGDYSGGLTLSDSNLSGVGTVELTGAFSYTVSEIGDLNSGGGNAIFATPGAADTDFIDLTQGTATYEVINDGAGLMTVKFAGNFNSFNFIGSIIGGGNTTVELDGDYSAGLDFIEYGGSFNPIHTLSNVTTLKLDDGFSYKLAMDEDNDGFAMTVDATALTAGHTLTFDGTNDPSGLVFKFGGNLSTSDVLKGGSGSDTLELNGNYNYTFGAGQLTSIDTLKLDGGHSYTLTTNDGNVGSGATLTVDATGLTSGDTLSFNGASELNGNFIFKFGAGNTMSDSITGGAGSDTLALTGGGAVAVDQFTLTSVENMTLDDHTWNIATGDTMVDSGATLNIDASALTATHSLTFDGSGETDGSFVFEFAGNFTASDSLTGGTGNDTLELNGDYSLAFGASTIASIEDIKVDAGHNYNLSTNDANVAAGATLTVDASALTSSFTLDFSGGAETDSHFAFIGGAGADVLAGGSQSDTFDLSLSDGAFVSGGGGNDTFTVTSAAHLLDDFIDGGTGSDTLVLNGDFSAATAITGSNVVNIETLQLLGAANSYDLTIAGGGVTGAGTFTVDASAAAQLTLDLSGIANAAVVTGSAGNDSITGSGQADTINGGLGADTLTGGGGNDTFSYGSGESNTATGYDAITDLTTSDSIHIAGETPTFFASETVVAYQGSLDADLASALSGMGAGQYAVVTLTGAGDPNDGHVFLVVDGNGTAGYTAGADYVIDITNFSGDPSLIHFI